MNDKQIKVLVIDDHQLIIDGLKYIMQDEEDVLFAGGANNMEQALAFLEKHEVDVVLADISMPGHSGVEVTQKIRQNYPHIKILALTMHEDISMITRMIEAGASGYLLKRTNMKEVLEAIRVVAANNKYLGREVQTILLDNLSSRNPGIENPSNHPGTLTAREKEILNLIAREMSNEQIAEKLFISERTVETHRRNIFTKTKTKTIVGLIKYAIQQGFIEPEK